MKVAIYCRVSTEDQNCERQVRDLTAFAERAGFEVVHIFKETGSGTKNDRIERKKVISLAQSRKIDAIVVTELTRWGRSTVDLLQSLEQLHSWKVSLIAEKGDQFDLSTAQGKMIAGVLSVLAEFERNLLSERTKSGLAAAVAKGKTLGRPKGNKAIHKHAKKVKAYLAENKSYRWIAEELRISKDTVAAINKLG